ncbi:hypothetical protein [Allomuricauda sp. M10]|uniref:hypothetical protein n=1 Tax=Allomuricauda sp. M10 TaxID=2683292 RepID=UPI001D17E719|nr:hypothetical protein [Muricauda sp. M10]
MKKQLILFLALIGATMAVRSQYVIKDVGELIDLKKLAQEKVYVHHTGPLVFAGEYLHYAFYCFNAQTSRPTNISVVGYVALVSEEGKYILEQKIRLDKGLSQGDFFIKTDVPSGNYKLLGYTQWMKNNGVQQVFKGDIVVINPYQVDQSKLLEGNSQGEETGISNKEMEKPSDSSIVQLHFDKKNYGTREKIHLAVKNYKGQLGNGNYTVRVQKKATIPTASAMNAMEYGTAYFNVDKQIDKEVGDSLFLPEQRGELFYGKAMERVSGKPVEDVSLAMSIPGDEFILKSTVTDNSGSFYTYVREEYKEPRVIVQFMEDSPGLELELDTVPKLNVSGVTFDHFRLKPEYVSAIKERSIYNQIENHFFSVKPDSVLLGDPIDPFGGAIPEVISLDDYTRFPTLQETLVEILGYVGYRNNGKGADYIHINQDVKGYQKEYDQYPAIVLIDGVFIPNHERIKTFDARLIKSISLIRDKFRLSGKDYQGMMEVTTFDGNFYETYAPEFGINVPVGKPLPKKNYYRQNYDGVDAGYQKIPDYRSLLFWEPHVELEGDTLEFGFYTSDLTGDFDVILDGFTTYGKPITVYKSISVRDESQ